VTFITLKKIISNKA